MKVPNILTLVLVCLGMALAVQALTTLSAFGRAIDNSAVYAELQQDKTQAELKKSQLLADYASQQALSTLNREELIAQGYTKINQPLMLAAQTAALASNLSQPTEVE